MLDQLHTRHERNSGRTQTRRRSRGPINRAAIASLEQLESRQLLAAVTAHIDGNAGADSFFFPEGSGTHIVTASIDTNGTRANNFGLTYWWDFDKDGDTSSNKPNKGGLTDGNQARGWGEGTGSIRNTTDGASHGDETGNISNGSVADPYVTDLYSGGSVPNGIVYGYFDLGGLQPSSPTIPLRLFAFDPNSGVASKINATPVHVTNVAPTLTVTKSANVDCVDEGGLNNQDVVYTYVITNTSVSTDPVTLTSVLDDKLGDLLAAAVAANGNSAVLAPNATVTFTVTQTLPAGNATSETVTGDGYVNTVTVQGADDELTPVTQTASAEVDYCDVAPAIQVVKTATPTEISTAGGNVTYSYVVTNESQAGAYDPLSSVSLSDTDGTPTYVSGDDGDTVLEAGETWTYTLTVPLGPGAANTTHVNTATVMGTDDEGNTASDDDSATVTYKSVNPNIELQSNKANPNDLFQLKINSQGKATLGIRILDADSDTNGNPEDDDPLSANGPYTYVINWDTGDADSGLDGDATGPSADTTSGTLAADGSVNHTYNLPDFTGEQQGTVVVGNQTFKYKNVSLSIQVFDANNNPSNVITYQFQILWQ